MLLDVPSFVTPAITPGTLSRSAQPVLHDDVVSLRPWVEADAPSVVAAYQEPGIQRWHARSMTTGEAEEWIVAAHASWAAESASSWAVDLDGVLAGRMTLKLDPGEGTAVAAYWTRDRASGRGVASCALLLATGWAFSVGVHRVELQHSTLNPASCRVARKAGFDLEGTRRESALHADGWHDMHLHGALGPSAQL